MSSMCSLRQPWASERCCEGLELRTRDWGGGVVWNV
jgi:hypothetical protein